MKKIVKALLFLLVFNQASSAQIIFEKSIGCDSLDEGHSITKTNDGGYMIAGYTVNHLAGLGHDYIIKLNASGDTLWTRSYGTQYYQSIANAIHETTDDGFIIAGYAQPYSGGGYLYLIKINSDGDSLWTKLISAGSDPSYGWSVDQTDDGGYIACGIKGYFFDGSAQVFLVRTDENGNELWTGNYGGSDTEIGYDVVQTTDGGFIVVGHSMSFDAGNPEFYLVKIDSDGNFIWEKHYGNPNESEVAFAVKETFDGGFAILGESTRIVQSKFVVDFILMRTNSDGDTLWEKRYSSNTNCEYYDFDFGCDGGYVISGAITDSTSIYSNACLIKTDDDGNVEWSKTFGGPWDDGCRSIIHENDGYVMTGYTDVSGSGAAGYDVYAIKVSCNGEATNIININQRGSLCSISPNPFTDYATISFAGPGKFCFSLFDLLGNRVMNLQSISTQLKIERGSLSAGIYYYRIESGNHPHETGKLVIQ